MERKKHTIISQKKRKQNVGTLRLLQTAQIHHNYTVKLQMTNIKKRSYSNKDKKK